MYSTCASSCFTIWLPGCFVCVVVFGHAYVCNTKSTYIIAQTTYLKSLGHLVEIRTHSNYSNSLIEIFTM